MSKILRNCDNCYSFDHQEKRQRDGLDWETKECENGIWVQPMEIETDKILCCEHRYNKEEIFRIGSEDDIVFWLNQDNNRFNIPNDFPSRFIYVLVNWAKYQTKEQQCVK